MLHLSAQHNPAGKVRNFRPRAVLSDSFFRPRTRLLLFSDRAVRGARGYWNDSLTIEKREGEPLWGLQCLLFRTGTARNL